MNDLSEELKPKRGFSKNDMWYKKHSEHKEFKSAPAAQPDAASPTGNDDVKVVVEGS